MARLLPEQTREHIITTALELYKQEGAQSVSFRRIAQALDISHMQPYRYFADKLELLAAMRALCAERFLQVIRESDAGPTMSALARLQCVTASLFQHIAQHPEEFRLLFALSQPPISEYEALRGARQRLYAYLRDLVQQAIDDGELAGEADTRMHLAWATAHGLLSLHLSHQLIHGVSFAELIQPAFEEIFAPTPQAVKLTARVPE